MRLPCTTDEPHGPRARSIEVHGLLLCGLDRAVQCQPQIIIGIHAEERAVSVSLEEIARPLAIASSDDAGDHGFRTLESARSLKLLEVLVQDHLEPDRRHVLLPNCSQADCAYAGWMQACSMSLVIVSALNLRDLSLCERRGNRCARLIPGDRLARRFRVVSALSAIGRCSRMIVLTGMGQPEYDPTVRPGGHPIKQNPGYCAVHPRIAFCGELPPLQQLHVVVPPYLLPSQRETTRGRLGPAEYGG